MDRGYRRAGWAPVPRTTLRAADAATPLRAPRPRAGRARAAARARPRRWARTTPRARSRRSAPAARASRMPEPAQRRQLVADVGLEHLRAVGADRVADAVAVELVEDPAELVPARHDAGVEVRGRADLEHDAALAEHRHRPRVVGGLHAVADAVGLEQLDDARDLLDRPGLAGVDRDPEAELAGAAQQAPVVGDPEGRGLGARRCRRRRRRGRAR